MKQLCMAKIMACFVVVAMLLQAPTSTFISAQTPQTPKYGGTAIVPNAADPATLNIATTTSAPDHVVADNIYEPLAQYDKYQNIRPMLAQSWAVSPDGLSWTFNLLRNATWQDGFPFTSADVKFSFEQVLSKYHPRKVSFGGSCQGRHT